MYFDYSPIELGKFKVTPQQINFGMTKIDNIIPIKYIGWCGVTMSPCSSDNEAFLEYPIEAFKYYKERMVEDIVIESKHMGSRACLYYDNDTGEMVLYSRGLFEIKLSDEDYEKLKKDCIKFCEIYKINGFIADGELEPWSFLSKSLIDRDFKIPIDAYKHDVGITENYIKTKRVIEYFGKDKDLKFYIFDIPTIKEDNWWQMNLIVAPNKLYQKDFFIFKSVDNHIQINLNSIDDIENDSIIKDICNFFEIITNVDRDVFYEGIVIKIKDRQLNSDFILPPYIKCRGKDYLRIIYGIDYDTKYYNFIKQRNLKRKRVQSICEYILNLKIYKMWLDYKNGKDISESIIKKHIAGFIGLREYGAKYVDATL